MLASIGREFAYNDPQAGQGLRRGHRHRPERRAAGGGPAHREPGAGEDRHPRPGPLGEDLTYTLPVANHGPSDASAVTVTDTLPASVEFAVGDAVSGELLAAAGTVTCDLGTLAEQATATVTIQVRRGDRHDRQPGQRRLAAGRRQPGRQLGHRADGGHRPGRVPTAEGPRRCGFARARYNQCTTPNRVHGPPLAFPPATRRRSPRSI